MLPHVNLAFLPHLPELALNASVPQDSMMMDQMTAKVYNIIIIIIKVINIFLIKIKNV